MLGLFETERKCYRGSVSLHETNIWAFAEYLHMGFPWTV